MVLFEYLLDVVVPRLYGMYERALGPLTDEQWHWVPDGKGNSIAFTAWRITQRGANGTWNA